MQNENTNNNDKNKELILLASSFITPEMLKDENLQQDLIKGFEKLQTELIKEYQKEKEIPEHKRLELDKMVRKITVEKDNEEKDNEETEEITIKKLIKLAQSDDIDCLKADFLFDLLFIIDIRSSRAFTCGTEMSQKIINLFTALLKVAKEKYEEKLKQQKNQIKQTGNENLNNSSKYNPANSNFFESKEFEKPKDQQQIIPSEKNLKKYQKLNESGISFSDSRYMEETGKKTGNPSGQDLGEYKELKESGISFSDSRYMEETGKKTGKEGEKREERRKEKGKGLFGLLSCIRVNKGKGKGE